MHRRLDLPGPVGALLASLVLVLGLPPSARCQESVIPGDEYAVLAAVLEHGLNAEVEHVVIADTTTGDPGRIGRNSKDLEGLARDLDLPAAALADWIAKNQRRAVLTRSLAIGRRYSLLTGTELSGLFDDDHPATNWRTFYERFPSTPGLLRVSRVGFDQERARAVVYVEFECGAECGQARLVHLSRDDSDEWRVAGGTLVWIAAEQKP